jgi:predicted metal-dependent hydrolase
MRQAALPFGLGRRGSLEGRGSEETTAASSTRLTEQLSTPPRLPGPPRLPRPDESSLVFVRHPKARRYVIRVRPDGAVRVTLPRWGSKREAMAFVERQRAWIGKERTRLAAERQDGVTVPLEQVGALKAQAQRELPVRLHELARRLGVLVKRVSIRNQRWRWGSCSRNGHICLNWRLVVMPEDVRDYVLIHELMHLKRLDHSPAFWKLVAAACPDYESARHWLRINHRLLDVIPAD